MCNTAPGPNNVAELLELARRARVHASTFAHHEVGSSLLAFATELEERAKALIGSAPGDSTG